MLELSPRVLRFPFEELQGAESLQELRCSNHLRPLRSMYPGSTGHRVGFLLQVLSSKVMNTTLTCLISTSKTMSDRREPTERPQASVFHGVNFLEKPFQNAYWCSHLAPIAMVLKLVVSCRPTQSLSPKGIKLVSCLGLEHCDCHFPQP